MIKIDKVEIKLLRGQANILTDFNSSTLAAIAGCVSGDTLIETPTGERCIAEMLGWHEVLSLTNRGVQPSLAYVFRKGKAQLYQVQTETGKIINATENHYLLTTDGQTLRWHSVGELMPMLSGQTEVSVASVPSHVLTAWLEGYLLDLQPTNLELYQSILDEDGCYSQRLPQDYQGHCSVDYCLCGEQSHLVRDSDREPSPLLSDALGHIPENWHRDGLKLLQVYIHAYQSFAHPSKSSLAPSLGHGSSEECHFSPYTYGQFQGHGLGSLQGHRLTSVAQLPTASTCQSLPESSSFSASSSLHLQSLLYHDKIVNIKPTRIADYYDMFVPEYHNYLAEGMVHHNTGGGKTQTGYWWLHSRMEAYPGFTWGMAEPTYPMLSKVIIESSDPDRPSLMDYFKQVGHHPEYRAVDKILYTDYGKIYLGSADNPNSMQGAAVRGYWLDEAGQMSLLAYETATQRCSMMNGQVLLTTTPYNLGWLLMNIVKKDNQDGIHVERWRSIDRPGFPRESYERARRTLPVWRFRMLYDAEFERPAGLIYDSFDEKICVIDRISIHKEWPVYSGHDFGGSNPAAMFYAQDPGTGYFYAFASYKFGVKTVAEQTEEFKKITAGYNVIKRAGGSHQEQGWRDDYTAHGWPIQEPKYSNSVEVGIEKVYALHKLNKLFVFRDMSDYLDEKLSYSRKLDDNYNPTDEIQDKARFHLMDSERGILSDFTPETVTGGDVCVSSRNRR